VNAVEVTAAAREMMSFTLLIVSPFLLAAVVASLGVGLLQASTRMNDLTLSFVPRFVAVLLMIYLGANWAGARMTAYIERAAVTAGTLRE